MAFTRMSTNNVFLLTLPYDLVGCLTKQILWIHHICDILLDKRHQGPEISLHLPEHTLPSNTVRQVRKGECFTCW